MCDDPEQGFDGPEDTTCRLTESEQTAWAEVFVSYHDELIRFARKKFASWGMGHLKLEENAVQAAFAHAIANECSCDEFHAKSFRRWAVQHQCVAIRRKLWGREPTKRNDGDRLTDPTPTKQARGRAQEVPFPTQADRSDDDDRAHELVDDQSQDPAHDAIEHEIEELLGEFIERGTVLGAPTFTPDEQLARSLKDQGLTANSAAEQMSVRPPEYRQLIRRVEEKEKSMPTERERRALDLIYRQGCTEDEAAECMGLSREAFRPLLKRSLAKFGTLIRRNDRSGYGD